MLKILAKEKVKKEVEAILKHQSFQLNSPQEEKVREIVAQVAAKGDKAVVEYTKKFDAKDFTLSKLVVSHDEVEKAYKKVGKPFRDALTKAIQNITAYHQKQRPDEWFETLPIFIFP